MEADARPVAGPARFYDGRRPVPVAATLRLAGDRLQILGPDGRDLADWPLAALRGRHDTGPAGGLLLHLPGEEARALVADPGLAATLERRVPELLRAPPAPARRRQALVLAAAALCAVAGMVFVLLPVLADRLAPLIPPEREAAFGRAVVEQVAGIFGVEDPDAPFCEAEPGQAALDAMVARLLAGAEVPLPYDRLTVRVADGDMVNAFAAPGGQVILFRGLLEAAESPDEIAGVLAHEIGHVAARDPTRLALRAAGTTGLLGLLFGDFTGGVVLLGLGNQLVQASYTREAEAAADRYALAMLRGAGISGDGLADFFTRLGGEAGELPGLIELLQTHPDLADRAARARAGGGADAVPALTPAGWRALRAICD